MRKPLNEQSKRSVIHASSWIICVLYFLIVYSLLWWSKVAKDAALYDAIISALTITGITYLVYSSLQYYLPNNKNIWKLFSIAAIYTLISILITRFLIIQFLPNEDLIYLTFSLPFRFVINFLIITCVMIINIFWNIQEELLENKRRKDESERMVRDAELYNLRQQLQPHFLFNSLNSIIALIGSKPNEARNMVFQLSDFLRGTMRKDEKQFTTVEEEINHLKLYLDIEKVRFGHRLSTEFEFDDYVLSSKIPVMILQPLVENAIKFGLYNVTEEVLIKIQLTLDEQMLTIKISNPFETDQTEQKKGTGFGLSSIQRRLYLLFSRTDLLQTETHEHIFISTLRIPQS
ncbi:sensor histidine kinase [Sphingobacterium humi]|uniref:GHKL domain-containing protein n=1 Tax=Sphingobacterium humi TaxID=1796905 RepID=A0A6N8L4D3_9SPHI|nr:histidine kinase [Sphingobacterium humi]MVZ63954.1 GHKL domain-containing protein [Sphingobacterium humi]